MVTALIVSVCVAGAPESLESCKAGPLVVARGTKNDCEAYVVENLPDIEKEFAKIGLTLKGYQCLVTQDDLGA